MNNKTILITGAGSGIGKALTEVFTKNGWETIGTTHPQLDVSDPNSIETFVKSLRDKPLDVLVNCAGTYDYSLENQEGTGTMDKTDYVFRVNTVGPAVLAEALADNLLKGTEKLVVSISSVMSTYGMTEYWAESHWSYGASKAALNQAMISFAVRHPDIKSVLIHPGWVKTYIGGKGAILEPEFSAQKIFELITDHNKRLPNKKLVDYEGKLLEF